MKDSKEFGTFMTISDASLCKRPVESQICRSFRAMISDTQPALGTDVSATRIGGSGYGTVFLARVDSIKLDGVDRSTAFLGADSQDPPLSTIVLYIYATRGTNLIQLAMPVDRCTKLAEPGTSDVSYYRSFCGNEAILAKALARSLSE